MYYNITPVAKPRMVRGDRYKKRPCVQHYWAFKHECILKRVKLYARMKIVFCMPMPKSWSQKKKDRMKLQPHTQIPDLDNLIKGLGDILDEDSHIYEIHASKEWAVDGGMYINELK